MKRTYTSAEINQAERVLFPEHRAKSHQQQIVDRDKSLERGLIEFDSAEGRYVPTQTYIDVIDESLEECPDCGAVMQHRNVCGTCDFDISDLELYVGYTGDFEAEQYADFIESQEDAVEE